MTWPVMARDLQQYLGTVLAANYRIERELGVGATARVYLAHDLKHDRLVALKVLRPEIAVAMGAERFLREIQTAARLSHPGILPLYDSGETDGLLYFTMPFIEGESLRDRLEREERLPVDEAVRITRDVAEALDYAHECGVIHRDVKPENILLAGHAPDGRRHTGGARPLVADFGIALALEESESRLTHTGMVVGTPRYMSPEQSIGVAALDQRTDVYSLACVLYEMLAGRAPFEGPTLQSIVTQRRYEDPLPIESLRPDVPRAVSNALAEALAKDPADRFASMEQFSAALVDPARRRRLPRRAVRRQRAWIGGVVALSALAVLATMAVRTQTSPLKRRDWVLVSDFDGPPSDPALGRVVRELVTTELNQSRFVSTMPRSALAGALRAAGRPETTRVNVDLARELAERSSVRAVVTGHVETAGDGYRLVVRVVDHDAGKEIAAASAVAAADSVVPVVQRLGHALREQLGERRSDLERNQVLLDIATPSLPAYRRYVDALARKESGDVAGSNRLLREAVALDTGFAAAWALMGLNYIEARNLDSARLTLSEALRRPSRLSTAQGYRLKADAAYAIDRDLPSAVKWYTQYLSVVPNSVGGRNNRGLYLYMLGRYEDALADFDSAAANNPFGRDQDQPMVINAADMLMALGRPDRAAERARALTGVYAADASILLAMVTSRWADAENVAARAVHMRGSSPSLRMDATTALAAARAVHGEVGAAGRILAAATAQSSGAEQRWYENARSILAIVSGEQEPPVGVALASDTAPAAVQARGFRLAARGDTSGARAALRHLEGIPTVERARLGHGPLVIESLIDGRAGRWQHVIETLGPLAQAGEHESLNADRAPSLIMRWLVADAYAHAGDLDSAVVMMERAVDYRRVPPGHLVLRGLAYSFAQRRLAEWQERRGDRDASRRAWAAFRAVFTSPDPSLRHLLVGAR